MYKLDKRDLDQYQQQGYLVPDFRLSDTWLTRLRNATAAIERNQPQISLDFVPSPHVPNYVPGLHQYQEWLAFSQIPEVLDIIEQLIGPDFLMWGSALFGKPGTKGKATPWHQDGEYWPIKPLASVTLWLAIDDATPDNGCLRVLPGSHRARRIYQHRRDDRDDFTLNQVLDDADCSLDDAVDVTLRAGQISIHDVYLVHGSAANNSGNRRAGLTYRYMPTTSHFDHDWAAQMTRTMGTTDMSQRPLFLCRGIDRCGANDLKRGHQVYPQAAR